MKNDWSVTVRWHHSNEKFVSLILRKASEAYRRAYYVTWMSDEDRFAKHGNAAKTVDSYPEAFDCARIVAKEVSLAKQLLTNHYAMKSGGS